MEPTIDLKERGPKKLSHIPPQLLVETLAHQLFPEEPAAAEQFVVDLLSGNVQDDEFFMKAMVAGRERQFPIEVVKLWKAEHFSVPEGQPTEMVITTQLNGCVATVVVAEGPGQREVVISHYPPFALSGNIQRLEEAIPVGMRVAPKKKVFILSSANRLGQIQDLKEGLKKSLGTDVEFIEQTYTVDKDRLDSGVLLVKIPPAGKDSVSCHTWEQTEKLN